MSKEWLDTVRSDGAPTLSLADSINELHRYTNATSVQLSDLSSYGIYEITGDGDKGASAFLQGQFCNDIASASPTQAQITGYCTPKGRLLALPTILGFEGGYRLLVPDDVAEAFIKRLRMFTIGYSVTIRRLDDWVALGLTVESINTSDPLADLLGALPVGVMSVSTGQNSQIIRWHDCYTSNDRRARYLRIAPVEQQLPVWHAVEAGSKHSDKAWRLSDVSAGVPCITKEVVEAFVPQMVNLQLIDALSFTKGCYPGQEIVARMQYLGKLKRHMRVFRANIDASTIDINDCLKPGNTIRSGADDAAGIIVDAMPMSDAAALILAVTKVTANEAEFALGEMTLEGLDMPYELPSLSVA